MAQQPLTVVVDLLARVPAFESAAGRGLLVGPELAGVKRFDNDRQADLLSITRSADESGVINEVLAIASTLAGETQLGADIKKLSVGLKQASLASTVDGSTQRIHWPWEPYRLTAEPGWRATLTLRGQRHESSGGPPATNIELSPAQLFGRAGLARARCDVVLEPSIGDDSAPKKVSYTVLLIPSWHGKFAQTILGLVALSSSFIAYIYGSQPRLEQPQAIGLGLGLMVICATLLFLISGWRPRAAAFRAAARSPLVASVAFLCAVTLPFALGSRFYLTQNPGPACETSERYWDAGAWILVPRGATVSCRPTTFKVDDTKTECFRRVLQVDAGLEATGWDYSLLHAFGTLTATAATPWANDIEGLKQHCAPEPAPKPVDKTSVFNCTDEVVRVGQAARPVGSGERAELTPDELKLVHFDAGKPSGSFSASRSVVWQLSHADDVWLEFTDKKDAPILTAPQDRSWFKVHINCEPSKVTVRDTPDAGGRWELLNPNSPATHTLEHCAVAPGLLSTGDALDVNVGRYVVENAKLVEERGLWVADEPRGPLSWKQPICVVRGAGKCRLAPRPRGPIPEGATEGPLLPCAPN